MIPFVSWVKPALDIVKSTLGIVEKEQEAQKDERIRDAGRDQQKLADQGGALQRAQEIAKRREDIDRASDSGLDDRLRKSIED